MNVEALLSLRSTRFPKEIAAKEVAKALSMEHKDAVHLLQVAAKQGFGDFVVGRRGKLTRFVWKKNHTPSSATTSSTTASSRPARVGMDYVFPLGEFDAELRLPRDLTGAEADRIGRFLASLAEPTLL